jgi:hypothetical protein
MTLDFWNTSFYCRNGLDRRHENRSLMEKYKNNNDFYIGHHDVIHYAGLPRKLARLASTVQQ